MILNKLCVRKKVLIWGKELVMNDFTSSVKVLKHGFITDVQYAIVRWEPEGRY